MAKALFSNKKYNHMNFELPFDLKIILGVNGFNLVMGFISTEDFQIISALVGLTMNLIYFLTKQYYLIKNNVNPDAVTTAAVEKHDLETALPFARNCAHCQKPFQPKNENQVFCSFPSTCFEEKLEKLRIKEIKGAEDITL